jgi:hypothetical protein
MPTNKGLITSLLFYNKHQKYTKMTKQSIIRSVKTRQIDTTNLTEYDKLIVQFG